MCMQMCVAAVEAAASDAFSVQRWTVADGLPGNVVTALVKSPEGDIIVMTSDGAAHFDGVRFSVCCAERCGNHCDAVSGQKEQCRLVESNGVVWVGTNGEGLLRIRQRLVVPKVPQKDGSGNVCFRDSFGRIWSGLEQDGVAVACQDGTIRSFSATEGLLAKDVTSFAETPDGDIWVGSNGSGLWRISGDEAVRFHYSDDPACDFVQALFCDSEGTLWICAHGDIVTCISDGYSKTLHLEKVQDSVAFSFHEEPMGRIWLATGEKLLSFMSSDFKETPGDSVDALAVDLFASSAGMSAPCAILEAGRSATVSFHSMDEVSFRYSADSPGMADCIEFATCLSPIENDWRASGKARIRSCGRLAPGRYKFEVRARLPLGVWGRTDAVEFEVRPMFYETISFIVAVLISVLAFLFAVARAVYVRRVRMRLAAIRQRDVLSLERARIARDIHDDIGARLTRISMLISMMAERNSEASDIAEEVRAVVHALDEVVWAVEPRNDTLSSFVDYIYHYAEMFVEASGLNLRVKFPEDVPDSGVSSVVRHAVYMCVKEALNNVVKHAEASKVFIGMVVDGNRVVMRIGDDGKGFTVSRNGGNGLHNMRTRMESICGLFSIRPRAEGGSEVVLEFRMEDRQVRT